MDNNDNENEFWDVVAGGLPDPSAVAWFPLSIEELFGATEEVSDVVTGENPEAQQWDLGSRPRDGETVTPLAKRVISARPCPLAVRRVVEQVQTHHDWNSIMETPPEYLLGGLRYEFTTRKITGGNTQSHIFDTIEDAIKSHDEAVIYGFIVGTIGAYVP